MLRILGLCLALLIFTGPVRAEDNAGIESTITRQLQAFNDRDVDKAWSFASPGIQGMFRTPENFGAMVRNGYPMVWTNADPKFLELRRIGNDLWQKLLIRDASGALWVLDYKMIQTSDGWQIDGVSILPAPDVGA